MAYNDYAASLVAADKPITALLMGYIRDNTRYLKDRLTTGTGHTHNQGGTDEGGAIVFDGANITAGTVAQGKLKTTTGNVYTQTAAALTLPGGEYGFYPQTKSEDVAEATSAHIRSSDTSTTYTSMIYLSGGTGPNHGVFARQRYLQASPPYLIGHVMWGHFLFLLRDIATGTVKAAYEAEDPPWAYNGALHLMERDPGRIAAAPHPFADYWQKDPAIDGLEIVMVDLTGHNTKKWKQDNAKLGKSILEDIRAVVVGKGTPKPHADYLLPAIPKFTDRVKIVLP